MGFSFKPPTPILERWATRTTTRGRTGWSLIVRPLRPSLKGAYPSITAPLASTIRITLGWRTSMIYPLHPARNGRAATRPLTRSLEGGNSTAFSLLSPAPRCSSVRTSIISLLLTRLQCRTTLLRFNTLEGPTMPRGSRSGSTPRPSHQTRPQPGLGILTVRNRGSGDRGFGSLIPAWLESSGSPNASASGFVGKPKTSSISLISTTRVLAAVEERLVQTLPERAVGRLVKSRLPTANALYKLARSCGFSSRTECRSWDCAISDRERQTSLKRALSGARFFVPELYVTRSAC